MKSAKHSLVEFVSKIASFMEDCLSDWFAYIKEQRKTYLQLNFFTIDQLVILQKELVKLENDEDISCRVYPLLSAVKTGCTQGTLLPLL